MVLRRTIDPDVFQALQSTFSPVILVYVDWPDGAVRAHSNLGPIEWGGNTWLGVGSLGSVSIPEESGIVPEDATVSLVGESGLIFAEMGIDPALLRGKYAEIFLGLTTRPGGTVLVGEPVSLFAGYVDARKLPVSMTETGVREMIQLTFGSGPSARSSATILHSDEDQQTMQPGDTLMRHLALADSRRANPAVW